MEKDEELIVYQSLLNKEGNVDKARLLKYIQHNIELQNDVGKVYSHITKGLLNRSQYPSNTVIAVFDNLQKDMKNKIQVCEDIMQIVQDKDTQQLILEYFGKQW